MVGFARSSEHMAALSQREKVGPGTPKTRMSKQRTPEIESEDGFGEFVEINCGSAHGKLYLGKILVGKDTERRREMCSKRR